MKIPKTFKIKKCRLCQNSKLEQIHNFGNIFVSNFVSQKDIKKGVKGIIFKHNLSHKDACYEIATSDIGICWRKNGWGDNGQVSTKVKEYELYNLPVIKNNLMPLFNENKILLMIPYCKIYEPFIDECVESALTQYYTNFEYHNSHI